MDDQYAFMIAYRDFLVKENLGMVASARVLFTEGTLICVIAFLV